MKQVDLPFFSLVDDDLADSLEELAIDVIRGLFIKEAEIFWEFPGIQSLVIEGFTRFLAAAISPQRHLLRTMRWEDDGGAVL